MTEGSERQVDFRGLVAGLATSAVAVLGQVEGLLEPGAAAEGEESPSPAERRKRVADGLTGVRQLIDTLAMLEEKTRGNLDDEESEFLQSALSELRIRYVSLANRPAPEKTAEGEPG